MTRSDRALAGSLLGLLASLGPSSAWAQAGPAAPDTGGAPAPAAAPAAGQAPPATAPTTQQGPSLFGYGNPQSANGTIGGGNATESSAHPITSGDGNDTFDLNTGAGATGTVRGGEGGPIFIGKPTYGGPTPDSHVVRRGDTLWGITDYYFQNPYQWPRLWSYNPQIKNPNWIYPGDEVHLRTGGEAGTDGAGKPANGRLPGDSTKMSITDRRRQVPTGTVFLRDEGWIRDDADDVWGSLSGSAEDKMFLSDLDEVYLTLGKGHDVHLGQELSIFRPRQTANAGTIVQILGTVRVDQVVPEEHLARAKIIESLDAIERGALIGPIQRKFEVVPPRRNDVDLQAHVLASLHPNVFFGQNQVVFIDKGESAGLRPGNRLFIVRRGDAWRRSLATPGAGYRVSPDDERPMPPMEPTPGTRRDESQYPDEVVAELRVLAVKKDSAVCLVSQSRLEVEINDLAVARKGY